MTIEYLKGSDNAVADALSWSTDWLDEVSVQEIMERAQCSNLPRAEVDNPAMLSEHESINKDVVLQMKALLSTKKINHNLADMDWVTAQNTDPVLHHVINWMKRSTQDQQTLYDYLDKCMLEADRRAYGN